MVFQPATNLIQETLHQLRLVLCFVQMDNRLRPLWNHLLHD